jgi:hypothetical protein
MSSKTDDILQDEGPTGPRDLTDPRKWLDYLDGKLSPEDERKLEKEIARSEFLMDALEGLRPRDNPPDNIPDGIHTASLNAIVRQLNHQLHQQLVQKKERRSRKALLKHNPTEIAVILIIALCLIGYFLYRNLHH